MNILIIESDQSIASYFRKTISCWGYNAEHVSTGHEALSKIEEKAYNVIILDSALSDMRLAELIPRLKKIIPNADIVVMTNHNTARLERSIRKLGPIFYMTSLVPTDDLRSVLKHIS